MKYLPIGNDLFITNRKKIKGRLSKNSVAIFNSNDVMPTSADGTMPFIQDANIFYLSGIDQEESILVLDTASLRSIKKLSTFRVGVGDLLVLTLRSAQREGRNGVRLRTALLLLPTAFPGCRAGGS